LRDSEIAWNWIHDNTDGRAIQNYHGNDGVTIDAQVIHDNLIHDIQAEHAISFGNATGPGHLVYNNIIIDSAYGFRANSNDGLTVVMYNNTCYNTPNCFVLEDCVSVTLRGNLDYVLGSQGYVQQTDNCTSVISDNNLWYGNGSPPSFANGELNVNPLLVNPGNPPLGLALQPNSPCVDGGNATTHSTVDFVGVTRDSKPDCGAFELSGGGGPPPTEPPPTPSGVVVQ
jgi:hypothetical protein